MPCNLQFMEVKKNSATASLSGVPYATVIRTGGHELIADEPVDHGGMNKGPRPHDYILAALSSCTCITVRMYADRKGIALTRILVSLSHDKVDIDGVQRDHIRRTITLEGDLTDEQRQRLLEIAGKCPTHRALAQGLWLDCELSTQ